MTGFTKEAAGVKSKNRWKSLLSAPSNLLYNKFKRLSQEVEAKNLIIDHIIHTTAHNALKEFRIAHPALFACSLCEECFLSPTALVTHMNDVPLHVQKEKDNDVSRFDPVEKALSGKEGRKLVANRLLFNVDLSHISTRLQHAKHQPYRPHIDDVDAKHEDQLRRGMKVVGSDAKAGIRPLQAQHRLNMQHKHNPDFHNKLLELDRTKQIDTYTTSSCSTHADIRFEWKGYVRMDIFIISEMNGWKPERMIPDPATGKYNVVKSLSPGVYRYRFIVDGEERIEEQDSFVWDGEVQNNILRVVNPPMQKKKKNRYEKYAPSCDGSKMSDQMSIVSDASSSSQYIKPEEHFTATTIDLHNSGLYDDGTWAVLSRIHENSTITALDLSNNNISDEGMMAVSQICRKLLVLEVLKLNGNGFSFDGCKHLRDAFVGNSIIRRLELCANRIGNDGADCIAQLLRHHRSLQELYLDRNYIDNDGARDLGESLQCNMSLRVLSLSQNLIHAPGSERLCYFLRFNATLEVLNLANNPLHPEGCKYVGELIAITDSIISLNISNTHLMHNKLNQGLYTITAAMRKNKSLKTLIMRNNAIPNEGALEIGYAMNHNRTITLLDVSGNLIHQQWFTPNFYLKTRLLAKMPTLQTSLERNAKIEKDPILSAKWSVQPREAPIIPTGSWTRRRKWKPLTEQNILHEQAKKENMAEAERIEREEEFVDEKMEAYQAYFDRFLDSGEGSTVLRAICRVITQYLKQLHCKIPAQWIEDMHFAILEVIFQELNSDTFVTVEQLPALFLALGIIVKPTDINNISRTILQRRTLSRASSRGAPETARSTKASASVISRSSSKMSKGISFSAADAEITNDSKINLVKFYNYFKDQYRSLVAGMSLIDSMAVQSKLLLHNPISQAKHIVTRCTLYDKQRSTTLSYRQEHKPRYLCHHCGSRFASERQLQKHSHKAKVHTKFDRELFLWESQMKVTRRAKYILTGTYFPSYYELIRDIDLPKLYAPQICDERGEDGRPVGVVEHDQTYRVEDSWGDWLQLRHNGHLHWTKYRVDGVIVMVPSEVDMTKLESYDKPVYYMVSPGLGPVAEIKVRKKPHMKAEVAGALSVGMVVAVWAKYENWLQIKYLHYDALWVLEKVDDIILFTQLHPYLQLKLPHILTASPQVVPPEALAIPKKNKFADRELSLGNAARDADSIGSLDSADSW